ncbi:MAG: hypothetical protein JW754_02500 [Candidatus Aenigmarchaeota archaeon]|nr:hypothetical protein [Candidatus Aenigmarchaeota archaeon]
MKFGLILLVLGLVLASGCVSSEPPVGNSPEDAKAKCVYLCQFEKARGTDLTNGPCISDGSDDWEVPDWVCDVAHDPRLAVDNLMENQCEDFRNGRANHFVEVNPECNFIKSV